MSRTHIIVLAGDRPRLRLTLESLQARVPRRDQQLGCVRIVYQEDQWDPNDLHGFIVDYWPSLTLARLALQPCDTGTSIEGDGALAAAHSILESGGMSSAFGLVIPQGGLLRVALSGLVDEEHNAAFFGGAADVGREAAALYLAARGNASGLETTVPRWREQNPGISMYVEGAPYMMLLNRLEGVEYPLPEHATLQASYIVALMREPFEEMERIHVAEATLGDDRRPMLTHADVARWRPPLNAYGGLYAHVGPSDVPEPLLREMARDERNADDFRARAAPILCVCEGIVDSTRLLDVLEDFRLQTYVNSRLVFVLQSAELSQLAHGSARVDVQSLGPERPADGFFMRWPTDGARLHPCALAMLVQHAGTEGHGAVLRRAMAVDASQGDCRVVETSLRLERPSEDEQLLPLDNMPELLQMPLVGAESTGIRVLDLDLARAVASTVEGLRVGFDDQAFLLHAEAAAAEQPQQQQQEDGDMPPAWLLILLVVSSVLVLIVLAAILGWALWPRKSEELPLVFMQEDVVY